MKIEEGQQIKLILTPNECAELLNELLELPRKYRGERLSDLGLYLDTPERRKHADRIKSEK